MEVVGRVILQVKCEADGRLFVIISIYALAERKAQYVVLNKLPTSLPGFKPSLLLGDFNCLICRREIRKGREREGMGKTSILLKQIMEENRLQDTEKRGPEEELTFTRADLTIKFHSRIDLYLFV